MTIGLKKGARIRVTDQIAPGIGQVPRRGDQGSVEVQREDGTVVVRLDDGRRAILASWEVELTGE